MHKSTTRYIRTAVTTSHEQNISNWQPARPCPLLFCNTKIPNNVPVRTPMPLFKSACEEYTIVSNSPSSSPLRYVRCCSSAGPRSRRKHAKPSTLDTGRHTRLVRVHTTTIDPGDQRTETHTWPLLGNTVVVNSGKSVFAILAFAVLGKAGLVADCGAFSSVGREEPDYYAVKSWKCCTECGDTW